MSLLVGMPISQPRIRHYTLYIVPEREEAGNLETIKATSDKSAIEQANKALVAYEKEKSRVFYEELTEVIPRDTKYMRKIVF